MAKHEEKYCPRCNALFECKVGSISLCQCTKVKVSQEQREYFNKQYNDCLCATCMKELQSEYNIKKYKQTPKEKFRVYFEKQ